MNFLSLFVLIPLLMMLGLWIARDMKQIRTVAVIGSTILLALSVYTLVEFLAERAAGNTATMLFTDSRMWYAPLNIHYAVGVDGVSVAMLLLSSIIVFAGVFASWKINPLPKEYFLWFMLLSTGVFGFFISVDLFTMFMFYEVALIPMYLLIGLGKRQKELFGNETDLDVDGWFCFVDDRYLGYLLSIGAPFDECSRNCRAR